MFMMRDDRRDGEDDPEPKDSETMGHVDHSSKSASCPRPRFHFPVRTLLEKESWVLSG